MKIGFTCGSFDVIHPGHIIMLKEAKEQCDYLVVGLNADPSLDNPMKNKPIQSVKERLIQLEAIKYIDEIVVYHGGEKELDKILLEIKPNIRISGDDHKNDRVLKDTPYENYFHKRVGYSSTELIKRIRTAQRIWIRKFIYYIVLINISLPKAVV